MNCSTCGAEWPGVSDPSARCPACPAMSEILTREEYAERINDAYFDQGMGMATHDVLLHHDAALRAEVGRLKEALDRQAAHYGGALREIADLFGALKRRAEALGPDYKFEPHYALKLSNDAEQLKRIAAAALEEK